MRSLAWKDSRKRTPELGDSILVKTTSGQIFFAVYTNEDEFDVLRVVGVENSRSSWFKVSSRIVIAWRYFSKE